MELKQTGRNGGKMTARFDALRDCAELPGHLTPAFEANSPARNGRSFLYGADSAQATPYLRHGDPVDLSREHPIDPLTLQPLVIFVNSTDITAPPSELDECHHLYWPRRSKELGSGWHGIAERAPRGKLAGVALRASLAEAVSRDEHDCLDLRAPVGPVLPVDSETKAAQIVMAVSKVRSHFAVETRDGPPHLVELTDHEFARVNARLGLEYFWDAKRSDFGHRILAEYFARKVSFAAVGAAPVTIRQAFLEGNEVEKREAGYNLTEFGLSDFMQAYETRIEQCRREGSYAHNTQPPINEVMTILRRTSIARMYPGFKRVLLGGRSRSFRVTKNIA